MNPMYFFAKLPVLASKVKRCHLFIGSLKHFPDLTRPGWEVEGQQSSLLLSIAFYMIRKVVCSHEMEFIRGERFILTVKAAELVVRDFETTEFTLRSYCYFL